MRLSASSFASLFPDHPENRRPPTRRATPRQLAARSHLEVLFAMQLRALNAPPPVEEYRFAPPRKWAFDFAWPHLQLAVEIEGGVDNRGRHVRPQGFRNDCDKYNEATRLGWQVFRYTADKVKSGEAIDAVMMDLERVNAAPR